MNIQDFTNIVGEVKDGADAILAELEKVPAVSGEAALTQGVVDLSTELVTKALAAWSAASGTPITVESIQALLPNPTPLTPPNDAPPAS